METNLSQEISCLRLQNVIQKLCEMKSPSVVLPKTATMSKLRVRYSLLEVTYNMFLLLLSSSNSSNSVFLVFARLYVLQGRFHPSTSTARLPTLHAAGTEGNSEDNIRERTVRV
jgi:hypothetical protein